MTSYVDCRLRAARALHRDQEMEADAMGLKLMADAGYDPLEMLAVWHRMKKTAGNESVEDPLLSHITYDRRMSRIAAQLPDARSCSMNERDARRSGRCR